MHNFNGFELNEAERLENIFFSGVKGCYGNVLLRSSHLDVCLRECDHLWQDFCDVEVLHLVPLAGGLVQHVHLHKGSLQPGRSGAGRIRILLACLYILLNPESGNFWVKKSRFINEI